MIFLFIINYLSVFVLILLPNEYLSNSAESLQQLSKANNEFGFYIFRLLSSANNNDIISPISLLSAFSK
jgi:serine protease inhibitor